MTEKYSDVETNLGIKNFRREESAQVYAMSAFTAIDTAQESLSDPDTFNKRFRNLSLALRQCFRATGDIAIRDKRYLETFFSGYVNPITTNQWDTAIRPNYIMNPNWDENGVPIKFAEERLEFNVDSIGKLNFAMVYAWVFVNGKFLNPSEYTLLNTAYGVKCYIKSSVVPTGGKVDITINRIYNNSKKSAIINVTSNSTSLTFLLPINAEIGQFYHHKYLKFFIKRGTDPVTSFLEIPRDRIKTSINSVGNTIKVDIVNTTLNAGEKIYVSNAVYFFEYHKVSADGSGWSNEIELTEKIAEGDFRPVPCFSVEDFDIFVNGFHLTPGVHYTLIKGGNEFSPFKIKFLFDFKTQYAFSIHMYKNETIVEDREVVIIREALLQNQGLVKCKFTEALPMMTRLGHMFINDKYVNNKFLSPKHKQVMLLNGGTKSLNRPDYRIRVIASIDLDQVIAFVKENLSEFDIVAEWIGLDRITSEIYKDLPLLIVDPNDENIDSTITTNGAEFYDIRTAAVEQLRAITDGAYTRAVPTNIVIDPNLPVKQQQYPTNIIEEMLYLESHMKQCTSYVIDPNRVFTNGTPVTGA